MELLQNTLQLLLLDPEFVVKIGSSRSKELTSSEIIRIIIDDSGNTSIQKLFKGHDTPKIRGILSCLFNEHPKPSVSTHWYLHILSINGLKKCPKCSEILSLDSFSKNKAMKSAGVDSWCLGCMKILRENTKDHLKVVKRLHQQNNSQMYAEASARRRARKLQAMPTWANRKGIENIYLNCPEGMHVDHWAPLQGSTVCGLHVESNLQYMPAKENISKSNFFKDTDEYRKYWI